MAGKCTVPGEEMSSLLLSKGAMEASKVCAKATVTKGIIVPFSSLSLKDLIKKERTKEEEKEIKI